MPNRKPGAIALDRLIDEITTDAENEQEQLWAFHQTFDEQISLPADATVIGEPVSILKIDYDGNELRGLTARCQRPDGGKYTVAACDVAFPAGSEAARYISAYRKWMGLPVQQPKPKTTAKKAVAAAATSTSKATAVIQAGGPPVELVVLSVKATATRCRLLGSDQRLTVRGMRPWHTIPGEIISVRPKKQWTYAGNPYLSGEFQSSRLDAAALGLVPLKLEKRGTWDPCEHYWGEEGQPIEAWAKPIISKGQRAEFEMEQVIPGEDPDDPHSDPITVSNDHKEAGDYVTAYRILMELCQADLRCLDAHSHLGNLSFDARPEEAIRHYEVGMRIGELSLPPKFDGLLPWGWVDNRPFLRCMHGYALCLWRLDRFKEAAHTLARMLWLNPADNQGIRYLYNDVCSGASWEASQSKW